MLTPVLTRVRCIRVACSYAAAADAHSLRRFAARLLAWPLGLAPPPGPPGRQRSPGQRRAAGASRVAGCEAPLTLEGPTRRCGAFPARWL